MDFNQVRQQNVNLIQDINQVIDEFHNQDFFHGHNNFVKLTKTLLHWVQFSESHITEFKKIGYEFPSQLVMDTFTMMLSSQEKQDNVLLADQLELFMLPIVIQQQEYIMDYLPIRPNETLFQKNVKLLRKKNPYLADITLPMDLSDLHDKLGDPTTEDEQWDTWKTSDDYKITAYHKDGSVWKIEANPAKSSAWAEDDIDFSGVDTAKSYTYDELAKEVGSTGTVYSLTNVNEQEKYSVIWYNNSGDSMVAEFDAKTDTAIVITK